MSDKSQRVANFHRETVTNLVELVGAAGLESIEDLEPIHINRRIQGTDVKNYCQLYPSIMPGSLLEERTVPHDWRDDWVSANASKW